MIAASPRPTRNIDWGTTSAHDWRGRPRRCMKMHDSRPKPPKPSWTSAHAPWPEFPTFPPCASEVLEVVIFAMGDENYAMATRHIRKIVQLRDLISAPAAGDLLTGIITPVPGAPKILIGVVNLHGEILAVFDLRLFLGIPMGEITARSRLVVLGNEHDEFGVLIDVAQEVAMLRIDEILEPPAYLTGFGRQYLQGVTPNALIVLDGSALLRDSRLMIDQQDEAGDSAAGQEN